MKETILNFTTEDFKNNDYLGGEESDCPIGMALRRLGWKNPLVLHDCVCDEATRQIYYFVDVRLNSELIGQWTFKQHDMIKNAIKDSSFRSASVQLMPRN